MEVITKVLEKNKNRTKITLIVFISICIVVALFILFADYVDSTYDFIEKGTIDGSTYVTVIFAPIVFICILLLYVFMLLFYQELYNGLIKNNIIRFSKYWFIFYISFFIPFASNIIPLLGFIYIIWKISNKKEKIKIIIIYMLPELISETVRKSKILDEITIKIENEIIQYGIVSVLNILLFWISMIIIMQVIIEITRKAENNKFEITNHS